MSRMAAVLLTGGRASRLGGIDKQGLEVGGETLLDAALAAVDGCDPVIVAGPDVFGLRCVREDPPFGGPVAGLVAALPSVATDWMVLLATDLPRAREAVAALRSAVAGDGVCLASEGRAQWLTAIYRTAALREAAAILPDGGRDQSMRRLVAGLDLRTIEAPPGVAQDVDTWDDLERAREHP
ncbi:MAG: molybdenum cofactor guanylyltransferase [Microbacterium sp.]